MTLYRADRKGNKTQPERFDTDGLLTKQVDSHDDPEPHKKYGWLTTITSHIQKDSTPTSAFLREHTSYLSFTSDSKIMESYLSGRDNQTCIPGLKAAADAYVFTADVNLQSSKTIAKGVYLFTYSCNYGKLTSDPKFRVSPMLQGYINCNLHPATTAGPHQILLIDAIVYLRAHKSHYLQAYNNAVRDNEWLVLPWDPMPQDAPGRQARIPVADFWTVAFYSFL